MAPNKGQPRSSHQALLELEKGTSDPATQLQEAARIVGIDLEQGSGQRESKRAREAQKISSPKEEWVLRWLMKKLKLPREKDSSYRLHEKSWCLLRELLGRIPPRSLASTLHENKLLEILRDTLLDLDGLVPDGVEILSLAHRLRSESSVTLQGSPDVESPKRGKKRKREDAAREEAEAPLDRFSSPWISVFLSMLEMIEELVALPGCFSESNAASISQLKLVLRGEPQISAVILGRVLRYSSAVIALLGNIAFFGVEEKLLSGLSAVLSMWKQRSDRLDDPTHAASNDAFYSQCLPQALQADVNLCTSVGDSTTQRDVLQEIERLIVLHVILPARQSFFSRTQSERTSVGEPPKADQVKAICDDISSHITPNGSLWDGLYPTLLDIAIRAVPRDTFRRQVNEAPWLEAFFVALATLAGFPLFDDPPQRDVDAPVLEELLQVTIDRRLNVSLRTLEKYAIRYSGLMDDGRKVVEWSLIARIIRSGVDVFLPNSGLESSKTLFSKLAEQVTSLSLNVTAELSDNHDLVKGEIVIPLLRGFSGARDTKSFVHMWTEQVNALESARMSGEHAARFSVWENDDVLNEYSDILASSLSGSQIVAEIESVAKEVRGDTSESAGQYSRLILFDALAKCRLEVDDSMVEMGLLADICDTTSKLITSNIPKRWYWRLWRIVRNILNKHQSSDSQFPGSMKQSLFPTALEFLDSFKASETTTSYDEFLAALEAFRFVVEVVGKADCSPYNEHLDGAVSTMLPHFQGISVEGVKAWNGRIETVDSPPIFAISYMTVLLANPSVVTSLKSETRRSLFNRILAVVNDGSRVQDAQWLESPFQDSLRCQLYHVWNGFVSCDWLLQAPSVAYDLVNTIYSHLEEGGVLHQSLISSLLSIPPQLVPRHLRAKVLDLLHQMLPTHDKSILPKTAADVLILMARLADTPKSSAKITSDGKELWKLASSIPIQPKDFFGLQFHAFRQLYRAVVNRALVSSDIHREEYFQQTIANVLERASGVDKINLESMDFAMLCLSLLMLCQREEQINDKSRLEILYSHRERIFNLLVTDLHSIYRQLRKNSNNVGLSRFKFLVDVTDCFKDLFSGNKEAQRVIRKIDEHLVEKEGYNHMRKQMKRQAISSQKPAKDNLSLLMQNIFLLRVDQLQGEEQRMFFRAIRQRLSTLTEDELARFLHDIMEAGFSGENASHCLLLAGVAISCLDPAEDRNTQVAQELSALFTSVSGSLVKTTSVEAFCLGAECLEGLLRTQPKTVSQWNVDNILATMAAILSPSGPQVSGQYAGTLYSRLCRLLGMLFGQYRKKLSGRFHLVVPVMQRLLRCLFIQRSGPSKSVRAQTTLPPWITDNRESFVQVQHAVQYTRLLTSLCDPTVSAVQLQAGGRADNSLTDNTKKVKSLAGQHLQYLVMEYAQCQLRAQLAPEIKIALMPGFYAVLDVMSKDTMRAMNGAMDSSSRAVFKGLYDDYVRFGRWNHD